MRNLSPAAALVAALAMPLPAADACTRILLNEHPLGVFVGRTMDWPTTTEPILSVLPRGMARDGGMLAGKPMNISNPARWTSKYGSFIVQAYGLGSIDGINEKGLGIHLLYLTATDFGPRDTRLKGIQAGLWGQYALDNAQTVSEALEILAKIQPVMVEHEGMKATIHMALNDASGDSAIIEYVKGKKVVHHGRQYRIMTNDPPYDEQLAYRAKFNFSGATRQTELPGNVDPRHRFVRADYFREMLPPPKSRREAIANVMAIARNVSVPFGAPNNLPGTLYNTEYRTAYDLTRRTVFFELTTTPGVIWTELGKFNLSPGAPVMVLDADDLRLAGDVTEKFRPGKVIF
ncbi:MAG: linear amide C-N hydrolase [Burkholderiales bacterium]|nr:linear amide C-N hydrolase [Burkholderiales bacterium]